MLVQILLLNQLVARLNAAWRRLVRQVEEIDVCLHETLRKQADADIHLVFALFKLESAVLLHSCVNLARIRRLLRLLARAAVLLEHLRLGRSDQLILLFGLGLLDDLTDARVRVENRLVFHLSLSIFSVSYLRVYAKLSSLSQPSAFPFVPFFADFKLIFI